MHGGREVCGGGGHAWWQGVCMVAEAACIVAGGACMVVGGHAWDTMRYGQ